MYYSPIIVKNLISQNLLLLRERKWRRKWWSLAIISSQPKPYILFTQIGEKIEWKTSFALLDKNYPKPSKVTFRFWTLFLLFLYCLNCFSLTFFFFWCSFVSFFTTVIVRDGNGVRQSWRMGSSSFVLAHPRPAPHDRKNFLALSSPPKALQNPAHFVNLYFLIFPTTITFL